MTLHLKAETEDAGTRLDAFVASRANGLTRSQAARYIEEGGYPWKGSLRPRAAASAAARR